MISYQWDSQPVANQLYDLLTRNGLTVWMDKNGGMGNDMVDSMAEAVEKASAIIPFMSQKYQQSYYCRLELLYANDKRVPVIPIKVQGNNWEQSGWLGLITAGKQWFNFFDQSKLDNNMIELIIAIQRVVPHLK